MKKLIVSLLCTLLFVTKGYAGDGFLQPKTTAQELSTLLKPSNDWVSYPSYGDRNGWSNLLDSNQLDFIKRGERFLDYTWQIIPATAYFEFERSGNRKIMENPLNENIIAIVNLMFAELAEGKGRFIDQLINGVFSTCEMSSWALSAHLIVQPGGRALPSHKNEVINLVSGDISALFSWIYYFFKEPFDTIDPEIANRIKYELQRRTIDPFMDGNRYWWMALADSFNGLVNNWNPWCNSNVLQTALLIEEDEAKRAEIVYKTMCSVDKFIGFVKSDGACEEGPAYWGHAAGKLYDYLQILYDATAGEVSLFNHPQIKAMGEYISKSYVGDGWVINFADASARMTLDYQQIFRYGKAVESEEMMQFAAYLEEQQPAKFQIDRDIYRMLATLQSSKEISKQKPVHTRNKSTWYDETEFAYLSVGKALLAAKGGHNSESHNHNDIGTFSLYINEYPVFIDAGVGTYTRQTFSGERYSIWSMQSDYHSLPLINGVSQRYGSKYRSKEVEFNSKKGLFSLDIAAAYPEEAKVKSWNRTYKLGKKQLVITDNFDLLEANAPNVVHFMTWGSVDNSTEGKVIINTGEQSVELLYDSTTFDVSVEPIELTDPRFSNVWGDTIYRLVFQSNKTELSGQYRFSVTY